MLCCVVSVTSCPLNVYRAPSGAPEASKYFNCLCRNVDSWNKEIRGKQMERYTKQMREFALTIE